MKPIHKIVAEFQAQIEFIVTHFEAEVISEFGDIEDPESYKKALESGKLAGTSILRFLEAKAICAAAEKLCEDFKEAAIEEAQAMFPDGKGIIFGVPISLQSTPTQYDWAQDPIWMDLNAASTLRINALKDEIKMGKMPVPIKSLGSKFIKASLKK